MGEAANTGKGMGQVVAVCVSPGGIPKLPQAWCEVGPDGLVGDGHEHDKHVKPERAVSLLDLELIEGLRREGYPLGTGSTGENVVLRGFGVQSLAPGTRLRFSGGVVLELTAPRKPCFILDAIHPKLKEDIVGRCGYMARVVTGGTIRAGDEVSVV